MLSLRNVGLLAAVVVFGVASTSRAQSCTPPASWRAPMVFVCADSPALAADVNGNFGQVVAWLEAKVGRVGQPVALDGGVVGTFALADNAVTGPKLADGAITSAKIGNGTILTANVADGQITRAKLQAGGVAVYEANANCSGSGDATFRSQCQYATANCGNTCNGNLIPRYENCAGVCGLPPNQNCASQVCTVNNTLRGYLVTP